MFAGELKAAANKLQREQAERTERERQKRIKEQQLAERQRQRQAAREEEGRQRRLQAAAAAAAVSRQDTWTSSSLQVPCSCCTNRTLTWICLLNHLVVCTLQQGRQLINAHHPPRHHSYL